MKKQIYIASFLLSVAVTQIGYAQPDNQRHVAAVAVEMLTTGDDKDGDTQILDSVIVKGNRLVASLDCCSAGGDIDTWPKGSDQTREFNHLTQGVTRAELLAGADVTIGMLTNGRDTWSFRPTLTISYDVGPPDVWSFGFVTLTSGGGYSAVHKPIFGSGSKPKIGHRKPAG